VVRSILEPFRWHFYYCQNCLHQFSKIVQPKCRRRVLVRYCADRGAREYMTISAKRLASRPKRRDGCPKKILSDPIVQVEDRKQSIVVAFHLPRCQMLSSNSTRVDDICTIMKGHTPFYHMFTFLKNLWHLQESLLSCEELLTFRTLFTDTSRASEAHLLARSNAALQMTFGQIRQCLNEDLASV